MTTTQYPVDIPADERDALDRERQEGEQFLWIGKPDPFRTVRSEWGAFLFAIPWTAFSLFWESMVIQMSLRLPNSMPSGMGIGMALFGLPFVGIGIAMLSAPFVRMAAAKHVTYAVTNRRILITQKSKGGRTIHSFVPKYRGDLCLVERSNGTGDITFAVSPNRSNATHQGEPLTTLFGIQNVRQVEQLIQELFFDGSELSRQPTFGVGQSPNDR